MKISACWISKNEEERIAKSIESVKNIADEMLIVDTGSTDKTVEIAESMGVKVLHFDWIDNFSAARNFTLQNISGDVVIFLDSDQYFDPPLNNNHRRVLEKDFLPSEYNMLVCREDNIDKDKGTLIFSGETSRIFRGNDVMHYVGSIHERALRKDGKANNIAVIDSDDFKITHTGYGGELTIEKANRNLPILIKSIESNPEDDINKALDTVYLIRESLIVGESRLAANAVQWFIDRPNMITQCTKSYYEAGLIIPTWGIEAIEKHREDFSRRQVFDTFANGMEKYSKQYLNSVVFKHICYRKFRYIESELLADVGSFPAIENEMVNDTYIGFKEELYTSAALAKERRGDRQGMFDYASKAITLDDNNKTREAFDLFFKSVKGLPEDEIIKFFDNNIKSDNIGMISKLIAGSQVVGYKNVFLYYCVKAYKASILDSFFYCLMLVASGKYAEVINFLKVNVTPSEDTRFMVFLAIICAGEVNGENLFSKELLKENEEYLGDYYKAAKAYNYKEKLDMPVGKQGEILEKTYKHVAFCKNFDEADLFLDLFLECGSLCFDVQAEYYMACGYYSEFLQNCRYIPDETDCERLLVLADANILAGNLEEAFNILSRIIFREEFSYELFNLLSVIAYSDNENVSTLALELYDKYFDAYDDYIDFKDIVNTKYISKYDSQKQKKALGKMKKEEFNVWLEEEKIMPVLKYAEVYFEAAELLKEKESYFAAFEIYFKLIASEIKQKESYIALADIYEKAGNINLAAYLKECAI